MEREWERRDVWRRGDGDGEEGSARAGLCVPHCLPRRWVRVGPARHREQPLNFVQQLPREHLENSALLPSDSAENQ